MKAYHFMANCFPLMKFKEKILLFNYFSYPLYHDAEYTIIFPVLNPDIFLHLTEDTVAVGTDSVFFVESTKMLFFFCPNLGLQIKTFILHNYEETPIFYTHSLTHRDSQRTYFLIPDCPVHVGSPVIALLQNDLDLFSAFAASLATLAASFSTIM